MCKKLTLTEPIFDALLLGFESVSHADFCISNSCYSIISFNSKKTIKYVFHALFDLNLSTRKIIYTSNHLTTC